MLGAEVGEDVLRARPGDAGRWHMLADGHTICLIYSRTLATNKQSEGNVYS